MPFEYQPTVKIRKRFSLRLNPAASSGTYTTTRSPFGEQLSRQLEAQLRMEKLAASAPAPPKIIGRSHSLSSVSQYPVCASRTTNARESLNRPARAGSLGHGSLYGSLNHPLPAGHKSLVPSPGSTKAQLNRNSSTSSSDSFMSLHSNASRASSPFYHLPSGPSSVGEVEGDEDDNEQWSEFLRLKSNSFNPCPINNVSPSSRPARPPTPQPDTTQSVVSIPNPSAQAWGCASFMSPIRTLRSLSLNLHSSQSSGTKQKAPASVPLTRSRESLYEPLESSTNCRHAVIVQKKSYKPISPVAPITGTNAAKTPNLDARRVKFNPIALELDGPLLCSRDCNECMRAPITRMASVRPSPSRPSIKRSLSINSSLDTIPEDSRLKMCLLSRTGMTL